jgi:hypothetical protein
MFVLSLRISRTSFSANITLGCYKQTTLKDGHVKVSTGRSSRKVSITDPVFTKNSTPFHVSWKSVKFLKSLHSSRRIGTHEENEGTSFLQVSFGNAPWTTQSLAGFLERGRFKSILGSNKFNCARTQSKTVPASIFVKLTAVNAIMLRMLQVNTTCIHTSKVLIQTLKSYQSNTTVYEYILCP